jgi:heat shock protein HslJ
MLACAFGLLFLAACQGGTEGLVGPTWQWTQLTETAPLAHTEVADPSRYTITLADDGSFRAQADCNAVAGTYTTDGDEITFSLGPSTLVACPEGSRGDQFVSLLPTVGTFAVDGSDLTLHFADAAGTMTLSAAD